MVKNEKKSYMKVDCGKWSDNVEVIFSDLISSNKVRFEKISISMDKLGILVGKRVCGNE